MEDVVENRDPTSRYRLAIVFWRSALQFLLLTQNASRETASQGNAHAVVQDSLITENDYDHATSWSDHRIILPVLFNLLHGIELLMKGFVVVNPREVISNNFKRHNLDQLRMRFQFLYPDELVLNDFFAKYTCHDSMPEVLVSFLRENTLNVEQLYQGLRYPSPDFKILRDYRSLMHRGESGASFFATLTSEISVVQRASVQLGRSLDPSS